MPPVCEALAAGPNTSYYAPSPVGGASPAGGGVSAGGGGGGGGGGPLSLSAGPAGGHGPPGGWSIDALRRVVAALPAPGLELALLALVALALLALAFDPDRVAAATLAGWARGWRQRGARRPAGAGIGAVSSQHGWQLWGLA
jgi:hypothetical protein